MLVAGQSSIVNHILIKILVLVDVFFSVSIKHFLTDDIWTFCLSPSPFSIKFFSKFNCQESYLTDNCRKKRNLLFSMIVWVLKVPQGTCAKDLITRWHHGEMESVIDKA